MSAPTRKPAGTKARAKSGRAAQKKSPSNSAKAKKDASLITHYAPKVVSGPGSAKALARPAKPQRPRPRQATVGQTVTRKVDSDGKISFAGAAYRTGRKNRGRQVQVAIVGNTLEISAGGEVLRVHEIKHEQSREHGAFANAGGRPSRTNAA